MRSSVPARRFALLAAAATGVTVFALPTAAQALAAPITIDSVAPNPFSPAGNSPNTDTVVAYTTGQDALTVVADVQTSGGMPVYLEELLPQPAAGSAQWTWDGTDNINGLPHTVADGTYRITLTTHVGDLPPNGSDSHLVKVDSTLPTLTSVRGGGATFYPVRDGYHDTWSPSVHVSEAGELALTIRNANGVAVRTLHAATSGPGRVAFTWNGRNGAGNLVPAGRYHWNVTEVDRAGNHKSTAMYAVIVSAKKLVKTKIVLNRDGASTADVDKAGCGSVSKASSHYANGILLSVNCGDRPSAAASLYSLRLPNAIRYTHVSFEAYGYSPRGYAVVVPLIYSTYISDFETTRTPFTITSSSSGWRGLGTVPVAGHYTRGHVMHFAFGVGNRQDHPAEFDLRSLRAVVTCIVLR